MTSSKIHVATVGISTVVTMKESLTYQNCDELKKVFDELMSTNRNRIVLDFKSVSFLDSQALELLFTIQETVSSTGGVMKIIGLNGLCRDILIATRLVNIFHVYPDLQDALRGEV